MIWLHGGCFQIQHKGHHTLVPCTKGVKQGSRGEPYQWNLVTRYLLWQFAKKSISWIQSHVLNFADDYHLSWMADSEVSLHRAVRDVADFFSMLEDAGLKINLGKSAAIIRVVGPRLRAFQQNYITRGEGKTYPVPIVKRWAYLGSTLSYTTFASDTVGRRVNAADHAFAKLKSVLGSRRSLTLGQRLEVYDTYVCSACSGDGCTSPRHVTLESNEALCARLHRPLPLAALKNIWEKKCRAWMDRNLTLHPVGRVPQYPDVMPALSAIATAGMDQAGLTTPWMCRLCHRSFQSSMP